MVDCASYRDGPTVGPGEPGPTGFPEFTCDPSTDRGDGSSYYRCCSDDVLAAGANNDVSQTGMCVHVDDIPAGAGLPPFNCPIACDPSADVTTTEDVCGVSRLCCQTAEVQVEDCIEDGGMWRPMTSEEAERTVPGSRGFCLALGPGQECPTAHANYRNACDLINDGELDPRD